MEGEAKGDDHGGPGGKFNGAAVPMRRWEDWERSRLRKLRREEKRRREFERSHQQGFYTGDELLSVSDARSQFDGSDAISVTSSEEDQWGGQIGGYNEYNTPLPPPPMGLIMPQDDAVENAETLDATDLEAMLEAGFDDDRPSSYGSLRSPQYQRANNDSSAHLSSSTRSSSPTGQPFMSYSSSTLFSPTTPTTPNTGATPNPFNRQTTDGYGPLGPLDPSTRL